MNSRKLILAGVSLVAALGFAGCTKEDHELKSDSASNSVRGPNDFNEEAQQRDNRKPQRVPVDPQREPNNPGTTQTSPPQGTPTSPAPN